jgi:hypothetical protein
VQDPEEARAAALRMPAAEGQALAVLYVGDQVGELVTVCGARAHAVARPKVAGIVAAALVGVACAVAFVVAPVGAVSWPFAVVALVAVLAVFGLAGGDDR